MISIEISNVARAEWHTVPKISIAQAACHKDFDYRFFWWEPLNCYHIQHGIGEYDYLYMYSIRV